MLQDTTVRTVQIRLCHIKGRFGLFLIMTLAERLDVDKICNNILFVELLCADRMTVKVVAPSPETPLCIHFAIHLQFISLF